MSILDIIEAATPGPWEAIDPNRLTGECSIAKRSAQGLLLSISNVSIDPHNARFIATFNPEHVALMEAVCEAARDGIPCQHEYASSACLVAMREDSLCATPTCNKALCAALAALTAYRKEHGL